MEFPLFGFLVGLSPRSFSSWTDIVRPLAAESSILPDLDKKFPESRLAHMPFYKELMENEFPTLNRRHITRLTRIIFASASVHFSNRLILKKV